MTKHHNAIREKFPATTVVAWWPTLVDIMPLVLKLIEFSQGLPEEGETGWYFARFLSVGASQVLGGWVRCQNVHMSFF